MAGAGADAGALVPNHDVDGAGGAVGVGVDVPIHTGAAGALIEIVGLNVACVFAPSTDVTAPSTVGDTVVDVACGTPVSIPMDVSTGIFVVSGMYVGSSNMDATKSAPALPIANGSPNRNAIRLLFSGIFHIPKTMLNHLVQDASSRIENNLIWVKHVRDGIFAWWFNVSLLFLVVGSFVYFLYASYGTAVSEEAHHIPFEPRTWNNAVRNVPITQYGQLPQIETGHGVQGLTGRTNAIPF